VKLTNERLLLLYRCLLEIISIMELEGGIENIFFCGKSSKWSVPNTLLVVVKDENVKCNRFYEELQSANGNGSAYLSGCPQNPWGQAWKPYQFSYRVITDIVFKGRVLSELISDRWEYRTSETVIDIYDEMMRIYRISAFV
jgi:hypothetical protein